MVAKNPNTLVAMVNVNDLDQHHTTESKVGHISNFRFDTSYLRKVKRNR